MHKWPIISDPGGAILICFYLYVYQHITLTIFT